MNKSWFKENPRALIGLGIFSILLVLNAISYYYRMSKRKLSAPSIGISSPNTLIASASSGLGETPDLAEMLIRLKKIPPVVKLLKKGEPFVPPSRNLFHWQIIPQVATEVVIPVASLSVPISTAPVPLYFFGGSAEIHGRKIVVVRSSNELFLLGDKEDFSNLPFKLVSVSTDSAILEDKDGNSSEISVQEGSDDSIEKVVDILKGKQKGIMYQLTSATIIATPTMNPQK